MTVLAILALALAPLAIKQLDRITAEKETAQLKAIAEAYRQAVVKTKVIPNHDLWDVMVATNLGMQVSQVRTNSRGLERIFLVDPDFWSTGLSLNSSYIQGSSGATSRPESPRLMVISSLSQPLPLASGVAPSSGDYAFSNIWQASEDTLPAGASWSAWGGKGGDLKIQRIHLGDRFLQLVLNNLEIAQLATYSIEGAAYANVPPSLLFSAYFIDGTRLDLLGCSTPPDLQYSEILHSSKSFGFAFCNWQSSTNFFIQNVIDRPGPLQLQLAADAFLKAESNPYRDGWPNRNTKPPYIEPTNVVATMMDYMNNYIRWRSNSPSATSGDGPMLSARDAVNDSSLWLKDPN